MSPSHVHGFHDGDEAETNADENEDVLNHSEAQGPPRQRRRFPVTLRREARVGLAVCFSFALLVGVMVFNKGSKGKVPPLVNLPNSAEQGKGSGPKADADAKDKAPLGSKDGSATAKAESGEGVAPSTHEKSGHVIADGSGGQKPPPESQQPAPVDKGLQPAADEGSAPKVTAAAVSKDGPGEGSVPAAAETGAAALNSVAPETAAGPAPPVPVTTEAASPSGDTAGGTVPPPVSEESPKVEKPSDAASQPAAVPNTAPAEGSATGAAPGGGESAPSPVVNPAPTEGGLPPFPPADSAAPASSPSTVGSTPEATTPPQSAPSTLQPFSAAQPESTPAPAAGAPAPTAPALTSKAAPPPAPSNTDHAAEAAAAVVAGQGDWVKLPNSRFQRDSADQTTARTAHADQEDRSTAEAAAPEVHDKIEPIPHVVQRGENFWTISRLYYRSGRYYRALWAANRDKAKTPKDLVRGTTIRIPPHEELDPSLIDPPTAPSVEQSTATAVPLRRTSRPVLNSGVNEEKIVRRVAPAAAPPVESFDEPPPRRRSRPEPVEEVADTDDDETERPRRPRYRVRSRYETLRSIAKATLGDAHREDEILDLNRKVIKDPNHLTLGQEIELPEDALISGSRR